MGVDYPVVLSGPAESVETGEPCLSDQKQEQWNVGYQERPIGLLHSFILDPRRKCFKDRRSAPEAIRWAAVPSLAHFGEILTRRGNSLGRHH